MSARTAEAVPSKVQYGQYQWIKIIDLILHYSTADWKDKASTQEQGTWWILRTNVIYGWSGGPHLHTNTKIPSSESSVSALVSDKCCLDGSFHLPRQHHPDISKYCPHLFQAYCRVNWSSWTIVRGLQHSDMLTHRDPYRFRRGCSSSIWAAAQRSLYWLGLSTLLYDKNTEIPHHWYI